MKHISLSVLSIVLFPLGTFAQYFAPEDLSLHVPPSHIGYYEYSDHTVYSAMEKLILCNQPLSYVSPLPYFKGIDRKLNLKDGEGTTDLEILEGNIDLLYPLVGGRPQSSDRRRRFKLSFHYNPTLRMYNDFSSPIVPTNQKVGFQAYYIVHNNYSHPQQCKRCEENTPDGNYFDNRHWHFDHHLDMQYVIVNTMHFSNGQNASQTLNDSTEKFRNNYVSGNFSTNFINANYVFTRMKLNHTIKSASAGIQLDGKVGGPLDYDPHQINKYGQVKFIGMFQFQSRLKSFKTSQGTPKCVSWTVYDSTSCDTCSVLKRLDVKKLYSNRIRLEWEYIVGNVSLYPHSNKARLGVHFYDEFQPLKWRSSNLFVHLYYGRDYMNVRYDDIIYSVMAGVTFQLPKFRDPAYDELDITN